MKKMTSQSIRNLAYGAMIAALYALTTVLLAPISYGDTQFRVSEALTLLPMLTPAAIPGLTIGCLIANLWGSASLLDMVFGPLATLLAAVGTRALRKKPVLAALCPVVSNGVIVGVVLAKTLHLPLLLTMGSVALGEVVVCLVLGLPLYYALRRTRLFRGALRIPSLRSEKSLRRAFCFPQVLRRRTPAARRQLPPRRGFAGEGALNGRASPDPTHGPDGAAGKRFSEENRIVRAAAAARLTGGGSASLRAPPDPH